MKFEIESSKKILWILLVIAILSSLAIYLIEPEKGNPNANVVVKFVDSIYDEINIFRTAAPKNEFITEYDFELSSADLNYFKIASEKSVEAEYQLDFATNYRKVKMSHNGIEQTVQMALYGDRISHIKGVKKSFKIKTDKEEFIENTRRINFILPLDRGFIGPIYASEIAKKIGLDGLEYQIALVRINGMPYGLYLVEHALDEFFLEKIKKPETVLINLSDNWIEDHPGTQSGNQNYDAGVTFNAGHITPFNLEISNLKEIDNERANEIRFKVKQLFEAVEKNDQKTLEELLDFEEISKFEAWRSILGETASFSSDNAKILYDTTTGKFSFAAKSEGNVGLIQDEKNRIDNFLTTVDNQADPLLTAIRKNNNIRHRKNELLWSLLNRSNELIEEYEILENKYKQAFVNDSTNEFRGNVTSYYIQLSKNNLKSNISKLKEQFEYNRVYINIYYLPERLTIEVIPDSAIALEFKNFKIPVKKGTNANMLIFDENQKPVDQKQVYETQGAIEISKQLNQNILHAQFGKEMEFVKTVFRYELILDSNSIIDLDSISFEIKNKVTGKKLQENEIDIFWRQEEQKTA